MMSYNSNGIFVLGIIVLGATAAFALGAPRARKWLVRIIRIVAVGSAAAFLFYAWFTDKTAVAQRTVVDAMRTRQLADLHTANVSVEAERARLSTQVELLSQSLQTKDTEISQLLKTSSEDKREAEARLQKLELALRDALEQVATVKGNLVTFRDEVLFEPNQSTINCDRREKLSRLVGYAALRLAVGKEVKGIQITGHTDNTFNGPFAGAKAFNQTLSEARARSVYLYLVNAGIPADHMLSPLGRGETQPVGFDTPQEDAIITSANKTNAQRERNRRVEIRLVTE